MNKKSEDSELAKTKHENARLHAEITKLQEELFLQREELHNEIIGLREIVYKQRDEIHALRNSRVVGRIIKTRDKIGNPYTLLYRSINKVRRTVAKFVPDRIRLPLMRVLRNARDTVRNKIHLYRHKQLQTIIIDNVKWTDGVPLVSVVIPYFNRSDTIDETLDSLQNQTYKNFEIIIVDDKSTDKKSIEKLEQLKGVKIIRHKTNQGVAEARNHGIEAARGKYIICLDSDDLLEKTFIEKATIALEVNPDVALISTYQDMFGIVNQLFEKHPYDPQRLFIDNMVITAAQFRKEAWSESGGYKSKIGYEDWEYWLTLAENGNWGKQIPEPLFKYRTSMQSRYVEDKDTHWNNLKTIRDLHPGYKKRIRSIMASRRAKRVVSEETALVNLVDEKYYSSRADKPNVLVVIPWMTFGGAETLIYNFCRQTMVDYNITFMTGLRSKNEWDYKFREITEDIYHLPSLFDDPIYYLEFISNYIRTRKIDILHIVHTDYVFDMLQTLKERHPHLKVIVTMFNDRVPQYVSAVFRHQRFLDIVTSDNQQTIKSFCKKLNNGVDLRVIPNGIDCENEFSPRLYKREDERKKLGLEKNDIAVFFVGRLSEEKNPDVFIDVARKLQTYEKHKAVKFFIIGDGPMRFDLEREIYGSKIKSITYLGYQSEIARYLSAADVFVLPSSIEGFPLSILEAMAMRVAVVASKVGAIPDVIKDGVNGYVIGPGEVDDIVKTIIELDTNRQTLERVKRAGRDDVASKYSHKQLGLNYRALYQEVLK